MENENYCEQEVDYGKIPLSALNVSTRLILSSLLNPEQIITTEHGLARDYRGLAEQMCFSYFEIKNFQRSSDPMSTLLEAFETLALKKVSIHNNHNIISNNNYNSNSNSNTNCSMYTRFTFINLLRMLENIGRYDVIDDITPYLINDAKRFISTRKCKEKTFNNQISKPLHVTDDYLSVDDMMNVDEQTHYDAYVCYADEDRDFVEFLSERLENEKFNIKLFIRDRDLLLGNIDYHSFTKLIEQRCSRVLVILSPQFLLSKHCQFQIKFTTSLAIERRCRLIIPIIYKQCDLPQVIKMVTKINFTNIYDCNNDNINNNNRINEWLWRKLIISIKSEPINNNQLQQQHMPLKQRQQQQQYLPVKQITFKNNDDNNLMKVNDYDEKMMKKSLYEETNLKKNLEFNDDKEDEEKLKLPIPPSSPPASSCWSIGSDVNLIKDKERKRFYQNCNICKHVGKLITPSTSSTISITDAKADNVSLSNERSISDKSNDDDQNNQYNKAGKKAWYKAIKEKFKVNNNNNNNNNNDSDECIKRTSYQILEQ